MEETSTENAKISDSGYSNTCSNSQSHTSTGSSVSRKSTRSASSGYHGGHPLTLGSCQETLPKPISKRKDKDHKKKKSNNVSLHVDVILQSSTAIAPLTNATGLGIAEACKPQVDKKTEDIAVVELVDATDPGVHNDNNLATGPEAGLDTKTSLIEDSIPQSTEDLYAAISMHDGLVLHATPTLLGSLGYPKDSWTGKLFIDLLDPRDKPIITDKIANEIAISKDPCLAGANSQKASIYCRLRRFTSFQCTSNSKGQQTDFDGQYAPYRINLMIQNFHGDKLSVIENQIMILVASFHPVHSAYKVPEETVKPTVFTTRHNAACRLSFVDPDVVQYLGYLPQDMIDRSMFDFYHPEDLPLLKDIYETVVSMNTSSFRSKPYRFIVQNGSYVVLETEWSSFVNPWTKTLEFVLGQHRVLKGPADPNIFRPPGDSRTTGIFANISEEVLKEAKVIQKEIKTLLVEGVLRKHACPMVDHNLLARKKELTNFVENILQDIKSPAPIKDSMAVDDRSFSSWKKEDDWILNTISMLEEHDSVMLGEISPHHEYFDSKSSTETPPSYNQLNYHDNIERFFNSNINVTVNNGPYASDEDILQSSANSSDDPGKNNASRPELKCTLLTNGSGNSGSAENLSSESNNQQSFGSNGETSNTTSNNSTNNENRRLKPPILTESLLNRHNEDMEKLMMQKHREQKKGDKRAKSLLNEQKSKAAAAAPETLLAARDNANKNPNRLKRNGSPNWEADNYFKMSKYDDTFKGSLNFNPKTTVANPKFTAARIVNSSAAGIAKVNPNINLWPPTSATMPAATITPQCFPTQNACSQAMTRFPSFPQMYPVYYLPMSQPRDNLPLTAIAQEHPGQANPMTPYCFVPMPYMATAMPPSVYPPIISTPVPQPMMYRSYIVPETIAAAAPMNVMPQPAPSTVNPPAPPPPATTTTTATVASSFDLKRPCSRATSVKAEPGSTIAMSESSKKIFSPLNIVSSRVSNEGGFSFGSCLNKSCDSSSNTDQGNTLGLFEPSYHKSKKARLGIVRKQPPWIEGVNLTPELINQYQVSPKILNDVLKSDMDFLNKSKQPSLVNEQLGQLFIDLDLEGFGTKLILEEAGSNSASDSSSDGSQSPSRMGAW